MEMPPAGQDLLGRKTTDMIGADTRVLEDGRVVGTVNYISGYKEFSNDVKEQEGHFFPLVFNSKYSGQSLTSKGLTYGEKTYTLDEDCTLIVRVENIAGDTLEVVKTEGEEPVLTLNFENAKLDFPQGKEAVAVPGQDDGMDAVEHASELIGPDVRISWSGIDGKVSGTLHWMDFTGTGHFPNAPIGHFMCVVLSGYDGKEIITTGSTGATASKVDPKWIIRVEDFILKGRKAKFAADGHTFATLDFSNVKLEPPMGAKAYNEEKVDFGGYGKHADMFDGISLAWEGTTAKVTGKLKWLTHADKAPKPSADGYYFAFGLIDYYEGETVTVTGKNAKTDEATDWVMTVTEDKVPITVEYRGTTIITFDLSQVTLEDKPSS